jgi:TolB-like protein/tetratricopeptide (TPR) repeat protein
VSEFPAELQQALKERYEILRELGRGGMATVYAARDLKLNREVAIKVLLRDLAVAMGPERFAREIEIAGHLSNPHILPVYDSGNENGQLYYVMPLIRGQSLRARLDVEKQLPIDEALRLSIEVAQALDYAHKQGVVHRDIKPENILLEGGHAIVADFGIARAISNTYEAQPLTQTGMTLGTAQYMSPEQVTAEKNIDGRSDIYGLACVTYEMLAGHPPFTGPNATAVMARQAMEMPPSLTIVRSTIPDEVEETVFQALAKSPVDRFDSAEHFANALQDCLLIAPTTTRRTTPLRMTKTTMARRRSRQRRKAMVVAGVALGALIVAWAVWRVATSPAAASASAAPDGLDPKTIAVLYFKDVSRDSSLGHVADALTEGLIDELSTVNGLSVVSRNGTASFRNATIETDSIARILRAGSLVEGSVEPVGDQLHVTARLVDGNGTERKSSTIKLPAARLLTVRDSVVRQVAELLRGQVGTEVQLKESRAGTGSVDAWSLLQRAERLRKEALSQREAGDSAAAATYSRADSLLRLSATADSKWPAPITLSAQLAYERSRVEKDIGKRHAMLDTVVTRTTQALALESNYAPALSLRGRARRSLYALDLTADAAARKRLLDSAEADLKAATDIDGTQAAAYLVLSQVYYDRKDNVSALLAARRAYEADAFLQNQNANLFQLFWTHYDLEQFPDADKWCREGARRFPADYNFAECELWLTIAEWKGVDVPAAWSIAAKAVKLAPTDRQAFETRLGRLLVAGVLARAGLKDSARHVLATGRVGSDVDPEDELRGYEAIPLILLGDHKEAIELLKSYVVLHPTHEFSVGRDLHWWWRPLQNEPGFRALLERRR